LYKVCANQVIRRCVPNEGRASILHYCYDGEASGNFGATKTATKILQFGFYWPILFKDTYSYIDSCDGCQRTRNISRKNEMPSINIIVCELFDI